MGAEPQPTSRIGDDYELLEEIGQGGFSRVHRARKDGRDYAVKILSLEGRPEGDVLRRFEREIETLAQISHPNLLELVDSGVDDRHGPYLVTPLIVGMTLRDLVAGEPLAAEAALPLIEPVFAAVAAMHAQGLVHRDLKPENVMVTPSGDVVLVDLGLALSEAHSRLTKTGTVTGSVPYMSPEQISAEPIAPSSDVWSLGVTLHELVAGKRPFARERPSEELASILAAEPETLSAADRRVSEALDAFVRRCLSRDPKLRFDNAAVAREALLACVEHCAPGELRAERSRVLSDPFGYVEWFADERVAALKAQARARIGGGDSFAAMRDLDRALAYRPDDEEVLDLVVEASEKAPQAQKASVESAARRLFGEHGPPASVDGFVDWVEKRISDGLSGRPPPPDAASEETPAPTAPAKKPIDAGIVAIVGIAVLGLFFLGAIFLLTLLAVLR